jgi:beta-glucanase (GH16 family)
LSRSPILAAALLLSLCLPAQAGWDLRFDDEFDGNQLDRSRWATRLIYEHETLDHLNDEAQRYRDNGNHVVSNGILGLTARKTATGWESGMIRSLQTFYYGYFETRVKFPKGRGIWPAFWINSDYDLEGKVSWPPEADIFEYVVNGVEDRTDMLHSAASMMKDEHAKITSADPKFNQKLNDFYAGQPLNEDWHVVGFLWVPHAYTVYLDGKPLYTRQFEWSQKPGVLAPPAHVILNFAVGGQWPGRHGIDEDQFPQAFQVDYVRVCQFSEKPPAGNCPRGPSTPDLSNISYSSPGDLARPVLKPDPQANDGSKLRVAVDGANVLTTPHFLVGFFRASGGKDMRPIGSTALPSTGPDQHAAQLVDLDIARDVSLTDGAVMLGLASKPDAGPTETIPVFCAGADGSRSNRQFLCPLAQGGK